MRWQSLKECVALVVLSAVAMGISALNQPDPAGLLRRVWFAPLALGAGLALLHIGVLVIGYAVRSMVRAIVWLVMRFVQAYRRRLQVRYEAFVLRHFLGSVLAALRSEFDEVYWRRDVLPDGFMLMYACGWTVIVREHDADHGQVMLAVYDSARTEPVYQTGYESLSAHAPADGALLHLAAMISERLPVE